MFVTAFKTQAELSKMGLQLGTSALTERSAFVLEYAEQGGPPIYSVAGVRGGRTLAEEATCSTQTLPAVSPRSTSSHHTTCEQGREDRDGMRS